jgi:hypothetical protein
MFLLGITVLFVVFVGIKTYNRNLKEEVKKTIYLFGVLMLLSEIKEFYNMKFLFYFNTLLLLGFIWYVYDNRYLILYEYRNYLQNKFKGKR